MPRGIRDVALYPGEWRSILGQEKIANSSDEGLIQRIKWAGNQGDLTIMEIDLEDWPLVEEAMADLGLEER